MALPHDDREEKHLPRRVFIAPGLLFFGEAIEVDGRALEMPEARLRHGDGCAIFAANAHT